VGVEIGVVIRWVLKFVESRAISHVFIPELDFNLILTFIFQEACGNRDSMVSKPNI